MPTTNESYGYNRFDLSHKPAAHFIRLLASAAAKGGNLLMNIGPMGDGSIDVKDENILKGIGRWMDKNGESIYGTVATPAPLQSWGVTTYKKGKLYLHVFDYPADGKLYVGGIAGGIRRTYLLSDTTKSLNIIRAGKQDWKIQLPATAPDTTNTVVVLELNEGTRFDSIRYIAPNSRVARMLAFDAALNGKGFGFGDGKTNRYYVDGWKLPSQTISWTFRNDRDAIFDLSLKYIVGMSSGGTYKVMLDGKQLAEGCFNRLQKERIC
ncbi:alpha-L-fucosidase [Niabella defluvii]|nr:alpha-L-fucosidase [Niabella sp. I65]